MKYGIALVVASAAATYGVPSAFAQGTNEAFPTGFYGGVTAEQAEVVITSAGYEIGDIEDDPTYGVVLGGRLNTGSGVVLTGELAFSVPSGMQKNPREVYCEKEDCGEELSFESERGLKWTADATLGVGYLVNDNVLVSIGAGGELAEVNRVERDFEDDVLDYSYEHTSYALGFIAFARVEAGLGDGWTGRIEYSYRHLTDEKWKATSPGHFALDSEQAFKGNAIKIGVTKNFTGKGLFN